MEVQTAGALSDPTAEVDAADPSVDDDERVLSDEGERSGPLPSPILEYVGLDSASGSGSTQWTSDTVAGCVADQGFKWSPPEPSDHELSESELFELHSHDESWVSVYGFGISTLTFHRDLVGPDLVGMDDERSDLTWGVSSDRPDETSDPNEEYLATLSDEEREQYHAAVSECQEEVLSTSRLSPRHEAFLEQFADDLAALYEQARSSPGVQVSGGDMMACIADAGYGFESYVAMTTSIQMEVQELATEVWNPNGPDEGPESESAPQFTGQPLTEDQQARLADIQSREIEMALAALDCDASPAPEQRAAEQAFYDLQVQYVKDNSDQLDGFLASHPGD